MKTQFCFCYVLGQWWWGQWHGNKEGSLSNPFCPHIIRTWLVIYVFLIFFQVVEEENFFSIKFCLWSWAPLDLSGMLLLQQLGLSWHKQHMEIICYSKRERLVNATFRDLLSVASLLFSLYHPNCQRTCSSHLTAPFCVVVLFTSLKFVPKLLLLFKLLLYLVEIPMTVQLLFVHYCKECFGQKNSCHPKAFQRLFSSRLL